MWSLSNTIIYYYTYIEIQEFYLKFGETKLEYESEYMYNHLTLSINTHFKSLKLFKKNFLGELLFQFRIYWTLFSTDITIPMKSLQEYQEMTINVKTYRTGKFLELLGLTIKYPEKLCYKSFTSDYHRYISLRMFWIMKINSNYRLLNSCVSCTRPLFHIIIELLKNQVFEY